MRRGAFTLLELLCAVAVLLLLAALLFPVLSQAREAGKKAQCLSNIKQMTLASLMYVADHNDTMFMSGYKIVGDPVYGGQQWYAKTLKSRFGRAGYFVYREGLIYPYMRDADIQNCPSAEGLKGEGGNDRLAYGLNENIVTRPGADGKFQPVRMSQVEKPEETLFMADAAKIYYNGQLQLSTYLALRPLDDGARQNYTPTIHARHMNELANVTWADGHAHSMHPAFRTVDNVGNPFYTAANFRRYRIGDILKSGCPYPSQCQEYYYALKKPKQP